jgi:hypothetical protein
MSFFPYAKSRINTEPGFNRNVLGRHQDVVSVLAQPVIKHL